jgi:ABC-2 type transport system ATP-binding protein
MVIAARNSIDQQSGTEIGGSPTAPVVETRNLRKTYGSVIALEGLDLVIPRAAVGLLGANGAGKTTLIRLLLGLSRADSGTATVLGYNAQTQGIAARERIGYMPESDCLPPGTTAADFVGHMAEMSGLPARAARQRAADVLYQVGLDEERYRLIKGFSTGMKQRVKLAQAIVHDPDLVLLDEPTNGMDPQGREDMLDLIVRIYRTLGIAVVVSSHILEDIERVCDYVVILNDGRLVLAQPMASTREEGGELLVRMDGEPDRVITALASHGIEARLNEEPEHMPGELIIRRDGDQVYDAIRDVAADLGLPLRSLRSRARTLEDLYLGNVITDNALVAANEEASRGGA